jgi:hypothetical protein
VAKRKTLFDDRPVEISELTYIIRQDISSLNSQIAQLQGVVEEHNNNVVMMLQSRLASVGVGFKDVLELRTQVRIGGVSYGRASRQRLMKIWPMLSIEHESQQGSDRAVHAYRFLRRHRTSLTE